jgi:transcriptional antiterminator RfaH
VTDSKASAVGDLLSWYVIYTKPRQEERAESNLRAWCIETYMPVMVERGRHLSNGQPSRIVKPLFPRYIFARFRANGLMHKVYYTRGVHSLVRFGDSPTPVADEIIELLRSQTGPEGFVKIGEEVKPGDRVRIVSGPLRNFIGIFEGTVKERERISILLTAVSFQSRVVLEREMIKKVA